MSVLTVALPLALGVTAGTVAWLVCDPVFLAVVRASARRAKVQAALRKKAQRVQGPVLFARRFAIGATRRFGRRVMEPGGSATRCLDELPELLDVIALGLSAGISFDAALGMYCMRYRTMLADCLGEAMRSWQLGMATRKDALWGVAGRLQVGPFSTFVGTVTESLDFGAPLVSTLTGQAESVRRARRMTLEEQIEKAPVKMLVPIGTLVLPAMLLAILGPILAALPTFGV